MASSDMIVSRRATGCGNKANDNPGTIGGAGGEGIELITEIQEDDSVTRGIADYIDDTAEDELYETCVPGEEEDDTGRDDRRHPDKQSCVRSRTPTCRRSGRTNTELSRSRSKTNRTSVCRVER